MKTSHHRSAQQGGFSLIELLMVMTVVALAASVVSPALVKDQGRAEVTSAARSVISDLRATRAEAMARQAAVPFTVDLDHRSYAAGDGPVRVLPASVQLSVTVPEAFVHNGAASVVFFPDGSSAGGQIALSSGAHRQHIDIRWLTGRVSFSNRHEVADVFR